MTVGHSPQIGSTLPGPIIRFGFTPVGVSGVAMTDFRHEFHFLGGALQNRMLRFGFQPVGQSGSTGSSSGGNWLVLARRRLRR